MARLGHYHSAATRFTFPVVPPPGVPYNDCRNRVTNNKNMINVTSNAANRIRKMFDDNNIDGALRLGVVGGGCSGLSYKFKFETNPRANDNVFEVDGVQLVVDPKSFEYLDGMTLDYTESLMERAFVFQNPKAAKSCGCGKSFIV